MDIFVENIQNNIPHSVKNLLDSHSPVLLMLDAQPSFQPRQVCLKDGIMNWEKFRDTFDQNINLKTRFKSPEDIKITTQNLTTSIQSTAWNFVKKSYKKHLASLSISAFTRFFFRPLIAQKRHARAHWQHTRMPSDKNTYNNLILVTQTYFKPTKNLLFFNSWISTFTAKDGS